MGVRGVNRRGCGPCNWVSEVLGQAAPAWCHVGMALLLGLLGARPSWALPPQAVAGSQPSPKAQEAHRDCSLCHGSHAGKPSRRALPALAPTALRATGMDVKCLACHQGPSVPNLDKEASKLPTWGGAGSSHIDGPFLERVRTFVRQVDLGGGRKAVFRPRCSGCHDIHTKDRSAYLRTDAFDAYGKPMKVRPTTVAQVCFACHAGVESVRPLRAPGDLGILFRPEAVSAHRPGAKAQSRQDLPSLRSGLFKETLDCTSCHGNPNAAGPRGPHASPNLFLLKAPFGREGDAAAAGSQRNDLCFTCHDRASIMGNQSFPWHAQHVAGFTSGTPVRGNRSSRPGTPPQKFTVGGIHRAAASGSSGTPTACATCHDGHGSARYPALIAFDPAVVSRASLGVIDFQRGGLRQGSCTLSCHGYDHLQTNY